MYPLLILCQALLMNWYIAKIVFSIHAENQTNQQFDEQLRLVEAGNQEEAFLKARVIGLTEEDSFINDKSKFVKWEFINVLDIIPLQKIEDGIEVYSRIHEMEEAKSYINFIHQRAISLRLENEVTC